jgi:hypothetical protein
LKHRPLKTRKPLRQPSPCYELQPYPTPIEWTFTWGISPSPSFILPQDIRYVVADAFYSKFKWVNGVMGLGLHAIGKLRTDANLKVLYTGAQKPKGRRRQYEGKLDYADLSQFEFVQDLDKKIKL